MVDQRDAAGLAALSIVESLLLAMVEKGVLTLEEAQAALEDASAAHRNRDTSATDSQSHHAALQIVERMLVQMNATDHPAQQRSRKP